MKNLIYTTFLLIFLSSCIATPYRLNPSEDMRGLGGIDKQRSIVNAPIPTLKAMEVYVETDKGSDTLYFKYRIGHNIIYATALNTDKSDINNELSITTKGGTKIKVLPLRGHNKDIKKVWTNGLEVSNNLSNKSLPILSPVEWHEFRQKIRKSLAPLDNVYGVVTDFLSDEETFIYFDKDGTFRAEPIEYKPSEIEVANSYRFDEIIDIAQPILREYLKDKGIEEQAVIFNTGDFGIFAYPFIYINLEEKKAFFTQLVPEGDGVLKSVMPVGQSVRMTAHLIKSNIWGVLSHPFTTMQKLFTTVTDYTITTLQRPFTEGYSKTPIPPVKEKPPMNLTRWERRLDLMTGRRSSSGTLKYLIDGEEFFPQFIDSLTAAKSSINMRLFIFDNDDYSIKIADILKNRSKDLSVRILLDDIGTVAASSASPKYTPTGKEEVFSIQSYLLKDSKVELRHIYHTWLGGDHSKSIIIDKRKAYIGGMNIGREYRYEWHDMMVEVTGPIVEQINEEFKIAWKGSLGLGGVQELIYRLKNKPSKLTPNSEGYPLRVLYTKPGNFEILEVQILAIKRAQSHIYIENPYFTDDKIITELIKARRRGVDVRVILTLEGDSGILNKNNAITANLLYENGIRIYIYPGMTHLKAAIFDGWALVGSANLDKMSLKINDEMNLATSHKPAVDDLMTKVFTPDFKKATELTGSYPEKWYNFFLEIIADQL